MSNMSHCRFHNTYQDLKDCIQALNEIDDLNELSQPEWEFATRMIKLCQQYIDSYEDFL